MRLISGKLLRGLEMLKVEHYLIVKNLELMERKTNAIEDWHRPMQIISIL